MKDDMKIEMEAGRNIQLDHIKEIMKENIPDLLAENQRLKEQLKDYENALKEYAKYGPCEFYIKGKENSDGTVSMERIEAWPGELAKETLKKWEV